MLSIPERRSLTRFPLQLSAKIRIFGTDAVIFAETKNISAGGVYLHTSSQIELGTALDLVLTLPPELTQSKTAIDFTCKARVVRVNEELLDGRRGIAAEIYSYDFLAHAVGV